MQATVSWISIAPVKGMRVLLTDEIALTDSGLPGDREFIVVDERNHMVNGKRFGALTEIVPKYDPDEGLLSLYFPDGRRVEGTVNPGDPEEITFHGGLERARPIGGELSIAISEHAGAPLRLMLSPEGRPGVDRGQRAGVTMLGEASLESLRSSGREFNGQNDEAGSESDPGPIDQRRFRMNFGIQGTGPYEEDDWIGREVAVGEARVRVGDRVGRCVVTTRDPDSGKVDMKTLHFLRYARESVDTAEALPFGVYGEVLKPGSVRIGDPVGPVC